MTVFYYFKPETKTTAIIESDRSVLAWVTRDWFFLLWTVYYILVNLELLDNNCILRKSLYMEGLLNANKDNIRWMIKVRSSETKHLISEVWDYMKLYSHSNKAPFKPFIAENLFVLLPLHVTDCVSEKYRSHLAQKKLTF